MLPNKFTFKLNPDKFQDAEVADRRYQAEYQPDGYYTIIRVDDVADCRPYTHSQVEFAVESGYWQIIEEE